MSLLSNHFYPGFFFANYCAIVTTNVCTASKSNACWYIKEVSQPQTFSTGVVMASTTVYIIPHKTMSDSQRGNAIFIVEVVWLVLRPI